MGKAKTGYYATREHLPQNACWKQMRDNCFCYRPGDCGKMYPVQGTTAAVTVTRHQKRQGIVLQFGWNHGAMHFIP